MSSLVRPGVFEVRANARRPVSALIRLDLPTLERPANAISGAPMGGTESSPPAAEIKSHAPANRRRPASISAAEKSAMVSALCSPATLMSWIRRRRPRDGTRHRIAHNGPPKKQKGDVASPFSPTEADERSALGSRLGDTVAPFSRNRRIGRVLGAALVAHGGYNGGNADLPIAAGQRRGFAMSFAVIAVLCGGLFGEFGESALHYETPFPFR